MAAYDAQGWHRTGSQADRRHAQWLIDAVGRLGLVAEAQVFEFSRLVVRSASLQLPGLRLSGVPMFDASLPPSRGITGTLGPVGSGADIAVVEVAPNAGGHDRLDDARSDATHRAIVAVMRGTSAGLALRNATPGPPYGPPVLQVSSRHAAAIGRAVDRGSDATILVTARRVPGRGVNVVATVEGSDPDLAPVVLLTPRSGWWHCAAERGGGLACWLAALGATCSAPSLRRVHFVATSGHELGHIGLLAHLSGGGPPRGATWVHLGANIVARQGRLGVFSSDHELGRLAVELLHRDGRFPSSELRTAGGPVGEASELGRIGAQYVSFVGTNRQFHLLGDRYPENVDLEGLIGAAGAITDLVRELADKRGET